MADPLTTHNSSFVAYVDESGDQGFVFKQDGSGSSRWFILSAAVIRKSNDMQMVNCLKETRELLGKAPKTALHFTKLKHEQRVPYIRRISELSIRTVNILIYKPEISNPETFTVVKDRLYRYATRYLVERISWLCRDASNQEQGDGFVDIIFSDRSHMSYDAIRHYLHLLMSGDATDQRQPVQIAASVVDPRRIRSVSHSKLAGLQVADAVASGIHFAIKPNRYGETEATYLSHIKKILYRRKGKVFGYGMKLWPGNFEAMKNKVPEVQLHFGDLQL